MKIHCFLQNKCNELKGLTIKRAIKIYIVLSVIVKSEDVWLRAGRETLLDLRARECFKQEVEFAIE